MVSSGKPGKTAPGPDENVAHVYTTNTFSKYEFRATPQMGIEISLRLTDHDSY